MSFKNYKMSYLPDVLNEYRIDVSNELSIDTFLKYGFYKIADAGLKPEYRFIKNPEVNPIQYNVVNGLEDENIGEMVDEYGTKWNPVVRDYGTNW